MTCEVKDAIKIIQENFRGGIVPEKFTLVVPEYNFRFVLKNNGYSDEDIELILEEMRKGENYEFVS